MNNKQENDNQARKRLKKELAFKKDFLKSFWHYHEVDKDLRTIFGNKSAGMVTDFEASKIYEQTEKEIKDLETELTPTV